MIKRWLESLFRGERGCASTWLPESKGSAPMIPPPEEKGVSAYMVAIETWIGRRKR